MNRAQVQRAAGAAFVLPEPARSRAELMREAVGDVLSRLRRQDRRVPLRCDRGPWKHRGTIRPAPECDGLPALLHQRRLGGASSR